MSESRTTTQSTHCTPTAKRRRSAQTVFQHAGILSVLMSAQFCVGAGFVPQRQAWRREPHATASSPVSLLSQPSRPETSTSLAVWWMGGSETEAMDQNADSCELVPVRIERPSSNSRKIFGDLISPLPLMDVWNILTDYDRLAIHVPNLKESKITRRGSGTPGDGQYRCRLFQKGAQKIVGFEFGASVTMEMTERIISETERRIAFKCQDSFFFSEFDGEWKVEECVGENGQAETKISYSVLVKPKGPVPVAALEWRIREDVPTNLRAVKLAAAKSAGGLEHAVAELPEARNLPVLTLRKDAGASNPSGRKSLIESMRSVHWYKDETMEKYMTE
jgi:hypothetical protein